MDGKERDEMLVALQAARAFFLVFSYVISSAAFGAPRGSLLGLKKKREREENHKKGAFITPPLINITKSEKNRIESLKSKKLE